MTCSGRSPGSRVITLPRLPGLCLKSPVARRRKTHRLQLRAQLRIWPAINESKPHRILLLINVTSIPNTKHSKLTRISCQGARERAFQSSEFVADLRPTGYRCSARCRVSGPMEIGPRGQLETGFFLLIPFSFADVRFAPKAAFKDLHAARLRSWERSSFRGQCRASKIALRQVLRRGFVACLNPTSTICRGELLPLEPAPWQITGLPWGYTRGLHRQTRACKKALFYGVFSKLL